MGDRHIGGQPSPFLQQIERAAPVAVHSPLDVNLFIGLGAASKAVAGRHVSEQAKRFTAVAVHPGWPDG
jgi:hypothetical protein